MWESILEGGKSIAIEREMYKDIFCSIVLAKKTFCVTWMSVNKEMVEYIIIYSYMDY